MRHAASATISVRIKPYILIQFAFKSDTYILRCTFADPVIGKRRDDELGEDICLAIGVAKR